MSKKQSKTIDKLCFLDCDITRKTMPLNIFSKSYIFLSLIFICSLELILMQASSHESQLKGFNENNEPIKDSQLQRSKRRSRSKVKSFLKWIYNEYPLPIWLEQPSATMDDTTENDWYKYSSKSFINELGLTIFNFLRCN